MAGQHPQNYRPIRCMHFLINIFVCTLGKLWQSCHGIADLLST